MKHGGGCRPHRTCLHVKFPASREFSREFFEKRLPRAILVSKRLVASTAYNRIPCSTEQGIFLPEQGIFSREQGILATVAPGTQHPCQKPLRGSSPPGPT